MTHPASSSKTATALSSQRRKSREGSCREERKHEEEIQKKKKKSTKPSIYEKGDIIRHERRGYEHQGGIDTRACYDAHQCEDLMRNLSEDRYSTVRSCFALFCVYIELSIISDENVSPTHDQSQSPFINHKRVGSVSRDFRRAHTGCKTHRVSELPPHTSDALDEGRRCVKAVARPGGLPWADPSSPEGEALGEDEAPRPGGQAGRPRMILAVCVHHRIDASHHP